MTINAGLTSIKSSIIAMYEDMLDEIKPEIGFSFSVDFEFDSEWLQELYATGKDVDQLNDDINNAVGWTEQMINRAEGKYNEIMNIPEELKASYDEGGELCFFATAAAMFWSKAAEHL